MFITKKALPRRSFLRGAGVSLALPFLDAMLPAFASRANAAELTKIRFGAVYFPNGAIMPQFTPKQVGTGFELTSTLKPFEPFRKNITVVTNLTRSHPGSQVGDHAVSAAGFLTGIWPKRTEAEDVLANTSIDQVVAKQIGQDTPLPSLELATEDFTGYVGGCSPGFSCSYMNTISWRTPTVPQPMETNPRSVFERLFGEPGTADQRKERRIKQRSLLDSVASDVDDLKRSLGNRDRVRLTEYLDNTREIERRIQKVESRATSEMATPDAPIGTPDSFEEHVALQFDLAAAAFESDITRVFTFMMSRELSQRTYPQIGVTEQHHSVSHHLNMPEKIAQMTKVNLYYAQMYARFLTKLRSMPDGDGTVFDHSLMVYGAGMGDSNGHASDPLPMLLAGGRVHNGDRHVQLPTRTPIGNLWREVAASYGVEMATFGDSSGKTDVLA